MTALQTFRRFLRDDRGATVIEYALIAAVVGAGLVGVLVEFKDELYDIYVHGIAEQLTAAVTED